MFGIPSLTKLLLLIAVVAAVWYGFKLVRRLEAARKSELAGRSRPPSRLDTVECPRCGTYVAAGRRNRACERADCPMA